IGAKEKLALSFRPMETGEEAHIRVVPPLLRREVLCCEAASGEYVHGYMVNAGVGESISQWHEQHPEVPLHFFWDKPDEPEVCRMDETLSFHQLDDE
ncbi:glycosyltransferase, partial [Bacteroides cellulosilyticus]|nr:glycosyltransferase [Bacteroides cellulosilyticus]